MKWLTDLDKAVQTAIDGFPARPENAGHNTAQINKNCMHCGISIHPSARATTPDSNGVYPAMVCDKCAREEIEAIANDEAYADHYNRMHYLREIGVTVLEDHKNGRK
jgi:hypothetical protein